MLTKLTGKKKIVDSEMKSTRGGHILTGLVCITIVAADYHGTCRGMELIFNEMCELEKAQPEHQ